MKLFLFKLLFAGFWHHAYLQCQWKFLFKSFEPHCWWHLHCGDSLLQSKVHIVKNQYHRFLDILKSSFLMPNNIGNVPQKKLWNFFCINKKNLKHPVWFLPKHIRNLSEILTIFCQQILCLCLPLTLFLTPPQIKKKKNTRNISEILL